MVEGSKVRAQDFRGFNRFSAKGEKALRAWVLCEPLANKPLPRFIGKQYGSEDLRALKEIRSMNHEGFGFAFSGCVVQGLRFMVEGLVVWCFSVERFRFSFRCGTRNA